MTVLSAAQSAMVRMVGRKPTTIFGSQDQMEVEIADLATDVAVDIMKSHDWRALTKFETLVSDGVTAAFPLPTDFDRMVMAQNVHDGLNWMWGYTAVDDIDEWIRITTSGFIGLTPGWWIILDGQFQFSPAPTINGEAKFPYISNNIGRSATDVAISSFTKDDDSFVLEDRLLTLGLIWRWKAQKGLEYAEDMASYEEALSQNSARDKGARVLRENRRFGPFSASYAYPWPLG